MLGAKSMLIVSAYKRISQHSSKREKTSPENWDWHGKVPLILIRQHPLGTNYFSEIMPGTGVFKVE